MYLKREDDNNLILDIGIGQKFRLTPDEANIIKEFFQHERDEELGRWRWPQEPHLVVYPQDVSPGDKRMVLVVSERSGGTVYVKEGEPEDMTVRVVAARYFAARPEPKPWHDAKDGEVWELTYTNLMGDSLTKPAIYIGDEVWRTDMHTLNMEDAITSARRIYPES